MAFSPQKVRLKNGKTLLLRRALPDDAAGLRATIKTYIAQSPYIPKYAEEFRLSVEEERAWIQSFLDQENSLLLLAEYEGYTVGNIDLTGHWRKIMQHTAVVGMGMLAEWRGQGLGSALLQAAIDWARANPILELLWLQLYTANKAAFGLYKKWGFQEKGIVRNFFQQEGQYFDNLTMSLELRDFST